MWRRIRAWFGRSDVALDLGTATLRVLEAGGDTVWTCPNAVAVATQHHDEILAIGQEALALAGREPAGVRVVRPFRAGRRQDPKLANRLVRAMLRTALGGRAAAAARVAIALPDPLDDGAKARWERRASSLDVQAIRIVSRGDALAAGLHLTPDVEAPLVVDLGAATTSIHLFDAGHRVGGTTLDLAGDTLTATIVRHLAANEGLEVGMGAAQRLKHSLHQPGSAWVAGRCGRTGLPRGEMTSREALRGALAEPTAALGAAIRGLIQHTPADVAARAVQTGVLLVGDGAHLAGLEEALRAETGLWTVVAETPEDLQVRGTLALASA
jgi:rod shape-determining protein MreB